MELAAIGLSIGFNEGRVVAEPNSTWAKRLKSARALLRRSERAKTGVERLVAHLSAVMAPGADLASRRTR
jgi:hypothetical protein